MSAESKGGDGVDGQPRVHRCVRCKWPIPDVVIAKRCERCGKILGDDKFLIESVDQALLREVREEADGCLNCGWETDHDTDPFCSTDCSENWFSKYTDAYLR